MLPLGKPADGGRSAWPTPNIASSAPTVTRRYSGNILILETDVDRAEGGAPGATVTPSHSHGASHIIPAARLGADASIRVGAAADDAILKEAQCGKHDLIILWVTRRPGETQSLATRGLLCLRTRHVGPGDLTRTTQFLFVGDAAPAHRRPIVLHRRDVTRGRFWGISLCGALHALCALGAGRALPIASLSASAHKPRG
jgi:hypothetical protein